MNNSDIDFIVLVIYTISMLSALFALWIKWVQDDQNGKMEKISKQYDELQKQLLKIENKLEEKGHKDPFKKVK